MTRTRPTRPDPDLPAPERLDWIEVAEGEELLMPHRVAALFGVDTKTVARWVRQGKLPCVMLPGGSRRFRRSVIADVLAESGLGNDWVRR